MLLTSSSRLGQNLLPIVLSVLALTAALPAQGALQTKSEFYPVSVWYSGGKARAPMLEEVNADSPRLWKEDLLKIKGLGFNTVRTWVKWSVGEPREGEYHLENLDLLLRLADEVGLKVIVQVYVDSAPEWTEAKYPEGRYAAQDGLPIPSQAAPGLCFDNKNVRKAVLAFFQEVARHAENSKPFYGWDLWSEPAALNWARVGYKSEPMFCYCPASMERFREWLQTKYGSLEKLNVAWHRTFTDWKQVEPPRYGTILTYTDFMDWRVYYGYKLAEDLKMRNDAVKAIDATHVTTSHAPNPSPMDRTLADPYDPTDDFLMKDSVDYFGTSFYPKLTAVEHNWKVERQVLAMDLTAAMTGGRGFYVGELQSGFGVHGTTIGSEVTPSDLELWTWGMVARGARAINYYAFYPMNAGYESGGYGMIQLDGTLTQRSRRAGETAKKIASNADLFLHAKPKPAEAAIVFSPLVPLLGGYDEENSRNAMHKALAGYHRMFFERNVPVDVLSSRELMGQDLEKYKLIVLPYPLMMTTDEAAALKKYVENGGHLFVEARPGWVNEDGHAESAVPGFGWTEMLGVRESSIDPGKQVEVKWGAQEFTGISFAEHFSVLDEKAKPVATFADGTPAAYEHTYGKGRAILLGTFAGQSNEANPVTMHPLGGILVKWAGLTEPSLKAPALVELREMDGEKGRFVFFFNHAQKPAQVELSEELDRPATSVREIVQGETRKVQGKTFAVGTEVPALGVKIYRIDY
ncbi:MAG TPA: beta-galactosidase [Candidatus Sulfotelmatobacter sp.]|nr:beta-galactosidase [Candidatus Sulfotelmatobacter sp.]